MNKELWDFQQSAFDSLRASIGQGVKRIVCQSPTGSGKTVLAAAIVDGALRKGNRMAFVVPSIQLIDQTVEKFYAEGIRDIGVIQANHEMTDWSKSVQVCSVQTLKSRKAYPEAKIVVIDECHSLHVFHQQWLTHPDWQKVPFIGLSATPFSKGLGKYFHSLLVAATTRELIDKGFLSPFTVYACPKADLSDVKVVAGDYVKDQLSGAMRHGTLTADIVRTWKERWGKDKTLVFAVDRAHAETLHLRFLDAGVRSAYQDANTSSSDRHEIERGFHDSRYEVVCNVGTLTQGTDWDVRCLVLARPTKSEILYVQIIGRALRTAAGKERAIILDHSDTTQELGFVTDIHHEHLDDGKKQTAKDTAKKPSKPLPRACPQCASIQPRLNRTCQQCGFKLPLMSGVTERDGVLVELVPGKLPPKGTKKHEYTYQEKKQFFAELLGYAGEHNKSFKWVLANFRHKFERWPDREWEFSVSAINPSFELRSWVRSRMIAFAKSKRREETNGSTGQSDRNPTLFAGSARGGLAEQARDQATEFTDETCSRDQSVAD